MKKIGTIKEIWRYPAKGMAGERVAHCAIGPGGLAGDRTWALRDTARKEIQSCKFRPGLLTCTASRRDDEMDPNIDVTFPGGTSLGSDDAAIHRQLSDLVGFDSTLEPLQPATNQEFYHRHRSGERHWMDELKDTFIREPGEPLPDFSAVPEEVWNFVSAPGSFFLVTPFHLITTATMEHMKGLQPEADWDIRRFRPNLVVETDPADVGLVEQDWVGKRIVIADTRIDCVAPSPRCGAITRAQEGIGSDKSMLRTIVREADQNLGIYGSIASDGVLGEGDSVYLE